MRRGSIFGCEKIVTNADACVCLGILEDVEISFAVLLPIPLQVMLLPILIHTIQRNIIVGGYIFGRGNRNC